MIVVNCDETAILKYCNIIFVLTDSDIMLSMKKNIAAIFAAIIRSGYRTEHALFFKLMGHRFIINIRRNLNIHLRVFHYSRKYIWAPLYYKCPSELHYKMWKISKYLFLICCNKKNIYTKYISFIRILLVLAKWHYVFSNTVHVCVFCSRRSRTCQSTTYACRQKTEIK